MSEGLNKIILIGNLGGDSEMQPTKTGGSFLKCRLATTEKYKDRNGVRQERTEWHSVVIWGKRGEALHPFFKKGTPLYIEGRIRYREYEGKDGVLKKSTDVVATDVVFLSRGGRASAGDRSARADHELPATGTDEIPY